MKKAGHPAVTGFNYLQLFSYDLVRYCWLKQF